MGGGCGRAKGTTGIMWVGEGQKKEGKARGTTIIMHTYRLRLGFLRRVGTVLLVLLAHGALSCSASDPCAFMVIRSVLGRCEHSGWPIMRTELTEASNSSASGSMLHYSRRVVLAVVLLGALLAHPRFDCSYSVLGR